MLTNLYKNKIATFFYLLSTLVVAYLIIFWFFFGRLRYLRYFGTYGGLWFTSISEVISLWLVLSFFFFPLFYIIKDTRISKERKIGWIILILLFNWVAFAFYLIKKKD
jgi:hypothetical protein